MRGGAEWVGREEGGRDNSAGNAALSDRKGQETAVKQLSLARPCRVRSDQIRSEVRRSRDVALGLTWTHSVDLPGLSHAPDHAEPARDRPRLQHPRGTAHGRYLIESAARRHGPLFRPARDPSTLSGHCQQPTETGNSTGRGDRQVFASRFASIMQIRSAK